jgi:hypothetical protein
LPRVELSDTNVYDELRFKRELKVSCDSEVSYLASNFCRLCSADKLAGDELRLILSQENLCVESEDWLYEFVSKLCRNDDKYFELFEFVRFEFVSHDTARDFVTLAGSRLDCLNGWIWMNFCRRLLLSPDLPLRSNSKRHPEIFNRGRRLDPKCEGVRIEHCPFRNGIIQSLKFERGDAWNDFVGVSCSKPYQATTNSIYGCHFATDVSPTNGFLSASEANSWIEYKFPRNRIFPTHYAIRSWFQGPSAKQWPKKWKLEGWNDEQYFELDNWTDEDRDLMTDGVVVTFPIRTPQLVNRVRFTQVGPNNLHGNRLVISWFELFGDIIEND